VGPRPDEAGAAPDLPPAPPNDQATDPAPPPDRPVDEQIGPKPQDPHGRQTPRAPDAADSYDSHAAPDAAAPVRGAPHSDESTANSTRSQETSPSAPPDAHAAPPLPEPTRSVVVEQIQDGGAEAPERPQDTSIDSGDSPQHPSEPAKRPATGDVDSSGGRESAKSPLREGLNDDARRLNERTTAGPGSHSDAGSTSAPFDEETGR